MHACTLTVTHTQTHTHTHTHKHTNTHNHTHLHTHTQTHTHTHTPTHRSIPTIQNLIYIQLKIDSSCLRGMKTAAWSSKHGRPIYNLILLRNNKSIVGSKKTKKTKSETYLPAFEKYSAICGGWGGWGVIPTDTSHVFWIDP